MSKVLRVLPWIFHLTFVCVVIILCVRTALELRHAANQQLRNYVALIVSKSAFLCFL